jgi:hypothetical protein
MPIILTLFLVFLSSILSGQVTLPDTVIAKISQLNGEILLPIDADFKFRSSFIEESDPQWDLIISEKQHKREIRYLFLPDTSTSYFPPDMTVYRLVLNVCKNEENSVVTARELSEDELYEWYQCDSGKIYQFPPKLTLGYYAYCRLIAIHREGRGKVVICLLYNDPQDLQEGHTYSFRFLDDK